MHYWTQQYSLLKNKSFLYYLYSCMAGTFASGLAYIVTIWMIVGINDEVNATLVGMVLFWIPSLVLSPHFGAVVDHHDRKRLIIIAESARAIMFFVFGIILMYQPSLWTIYALLILSGCFAALYQPLLPAFVHELVSSEQLLYANANINMAYEFGNIIGRGIITVAVLTLLSTYAALFMVAILYVISAVAIIPVQRYHRAEAGLLPRKLLFIKSIKDGYQYLFANRKLFWYAIVQSTILMSLMAAPVLVGPYVKTVLHAGNRVFGISEAAISSGAIVGAFFWTYLVKYITKESCIALACILAGFSYSVLAATSSVDYALVAFLILGFSWGSFALIMSLVQTYADKVFQGRVQAAIASGVTLIFIFFSIFQYILGESYSAQHAFMMLTWICLLSFLGIIKAKNINQ